MSRDPETRPSPEPEGGAAAGARRRPWRLAARVLAVQVVTLIALWLLQLTFGG